MEKRYKYIILGAGPAGLTFANLLKQHKENSFVVLEAMETAGGLCRSKEIDGFPLDTGGGHFLDVRRPKVNNFLFHFMPENEWNLFTRNSKINYRGTLIDHPFEANIWEMDIESQIDFLKSIATAGCNRGAKMPENFVDWIYWKLGDKIAEEYMIPYNKKIFSDNLNDLGTYWLDKLPNVSFEDTLRSCLEHKAFGEEPGHAKFYYPKKYGYGEIWCRMADEIRQHIVYQMPVDRIDFEQGIVSCIDESTFSGENIVTTIPWAEFKDITGIPEKIKKSINRLKYSSIEIKYYPEMLNTDAHWIYYPAKELEYHRVLVRHNFCPNSKGYWTETNMERVSSTPRENAFVNQYAYPLNTVDKREIMNNLIMWAERYKIYPLGRWGEHQHYNSDVTVLKAMELFERLEGGNSN